MGLVERFEQSGQLPTKPTDSTRKFDLLLWESVSPPVRPQSCPPERICISNWSRSLPKKHGKRALPSLLSFSKSALPFTKGCALVAFSMKILPDFRSLLEVGAKIHMWCSYPLSSYYKKR